MIGRTLHASPGLPWGVALFLLAAGGLAVLGIVGKTPHPTILAMAPFGIALALFLSRPRKVTLEFTEEGVLSTQPPLNIAYEAIEGVRVQGRSGNPEEKGASYFPIEILHESGTLLLSQNKNVPSAEVFRFLFDRFTPSGSRDVPEPLFEHLKEHLELFGPEKVWSYRARAHLGSEYRRGRAVCLALLIVAVSWFFAGFLGRDYTPWMVLGVMVAIISGLFFWAFSSQSRHSGIKNWRQAGLVISPQCLALVQGDLKGELRWDEIKEVKFQRKPGFWEIGPSGPRAGISLTVEGAKIVIANVYDRPLFLIYQRIREYWR